MKKNIRLIIIAVIVIAVLVGAVAVVMSIPKQNDGGASRTSNDILLYDKTSQHAEIITVSNSSGEYTLYGLDYSDQMSKALEEQSLEKKESSSAQRTESGFTPADIYMHYTMQDYEDETLDKDMTDLLAYQCSYVTALQIVDKTGTKYAEYGLEKPLATVNVTFSDESIETLYIGNSAPGDKGIYFRRSGNSNVYLAQKLSVNMFLVDGLQLFSKQLTQELEDEEEITEVAISGNGYKDEILISNEAVINSINMYNMISPHREICSESVTGGFGSVFYDLEGSWIASLQVNDEDIAKYGLDDPYMDITVDTNKDKRIHLLVSKLDDNDECYIMAEGSSFICGMSKEDCKDWYGIDYTAFLSGTILNPDFEYLSSAEINNGGKIYTYNISYEIKQDDQLRDTKSFSVELNGKSVEYSSFYTCISEIASLVRSDSPENGIDGCEEVFSAVLTFKDGEAQVQDIVRLYKTPDSRYIITLNDVVEGYADKDAVSELLKHDLTVPGEDE